MVVLEGKLFKEIGTYGGTWWFCGDYIHHNV